jgi:basic amino acid/polyamine antiporter, APA family
MPMAGRDKETILAGAPGTVTLRRSLTLFHAVLYGMGVTIGAGIYVLVGTAAARAGMQAPLAFVAAAILMGLTAASFAELGTRMPVAAGEAAYVREAFGSDRWSTVVGVLVIAIAIVAAAAISVGSAGYIAVFVALPAPLIVAIVVLSMAAIAAWGIKESVTFAGAITLVEIGGLVVLIVAGALSEPGLVTRLPEMVRPGASPAAVFGLVSATLLAVFAFIGFEALVNVAEELRDPPRTLPRAIFLTLALTTLLYVLVVWVALVAVPAGDLAASKAPLALAFERLTGTSARIMGAVAVLATLNGIVVQIILAARVLYGLARQGALPPVFQKVSPLTQTPLVATAAAAAVVLALALLLPLEGLADLSARFTLVLFAIVNLALVRIKSREDKPPQHIYLAPRWVPWAALVSCLLLLLVDLAVTIAVSIGSPDG